MKSKNVETLIQERENLRDLLEDIMERIQEFREEVLTGLDIEKYVKNLCKARVRDNDTVDEVEDAGVIEA